MLMNQTYFVASDFSPVVSSLDGRQRRQRSNHELSSHFLDFDRKTSLAGNKPTLSILLTSSYSDSFVRGDANEEFISALSLDPGFAIERVLYEGLERRSIHDFE